MKTFVNHVTKFEFYLIINNLNNSIVPVPSRWECYVDDVRTIDLEKNPPNRIIAPWMIVPPENCYSDDCPEDNWPKAISPIL